MFLRMLTEEYRKKFAELCQKGIEAEDENEPAPDNAHPSAPETQTIGEWVTPIISPRRVDVNFRLE